MLDSRVGDIVLIIFLLQDNLVTVRGRVLESLTLRTIKMNLMAGTKHDHICRIWKRWCAPPITVIHRRGSCSESSQVALDSRQGYRVHKVMILMI